MAKGRRGNGEGTIYRRKDGRWTGQVTVGRRDDGKLDRRTLYGKTRAEVADKMATLQTDRVKGDVLKPSKETLGPYLSRWLEHHKLFGGRSGKGLRPNTVRIYERMIRLHINPFIGWVQLTKLQPSHLKMLYAWMKKEKHLSTRMTEIAHRLLHVALEAAVTEDRIINRNPCDMLKNKPRTNYNPQDRDVLARDATGRVLDHVTGTPYHLPFLLAMATGMRRGEILGLRWRNVELQEGVIHVREQLQLDEDKKWTVKPILKTEASRRDIPIPNDVVRVLQRHRAKQKVVSLDGFVCTTRKGKWMRPDVLNDAWARVRKELNLPAKLTLHDLRHSYTNWQAEAGTDIKAVGEILGHKDERTTLRVYRSVTERMRKEAAQAMEGIAGAADE